MNIRNRRTQGAEASLFPEIDDDRRKMAVIANALFHHLTRTSNGPMKYCEQCGTPLVSDYCQHCKAAPVAGKVGVA